MFWGRHHHDDSNYDLRCKCLSSALTWSIYICKQKATSKTGLGVRSAFCCRRLKPTLQVAASTQKKRHLHQITNTKAQAGTGRTNTGGGGGITRTKWTKSLAQKIPTQREFPISLHLQTVEPIRCEDFEIFSLSRLFDLARTSGRVSDRERRDRPRGMPSSSSSLRDGCNRTCP